MKASNPRIPNPDSGDEEEGEEEENDGYLDPNDLEIIDDETWDPTDEDILAYAIKLGFDIENDPDELFEIAYSFLKYPLPQGWRRAWYKESKELMYINMEDGEIELATEIEDMARQTYWEKKQEMIEAHQKMSKETEVTSKVVPRTKIPPLNPLAKSNQSVSVNTSNQIVPNVNNKPANKDIDIKGNSNSRDASPNASFWSKSNNKSDNKSDITFTDNSEIESKENNIIQPTGLGKSSLKDISTNKESNTKPTISATVDSATTATKSKNIELMKKQYFDQKWKELKEYESQLRDKYSELKTQHKERKLQIKAQFDNDYTNKTQAQMDKIQAQYKDKLKWFESQLQNNNKKDIDKYKASTKDEIQNNIVTITQEQAKQTETEISRLEDTISSLKVKIKTTKEQVISSQTATQNGKQSFDKNKQLLEEKYEIQKRNNWKKFELDIKQLERDFEGHFIKHQETFKNKSIQISSKVILQSNSYENVLLQSKIFDNYQKVWDEDYEINCKAIAQEITMNKEKDISDFRKSMHLNNQDKWKQISLEISDLEKDYFTSLSQIRESSKNISWRNEEQLKQNFEQSLIMCEKWKRKIVDEGEGYVSQLVGKIKENIITESDSTKLELKIEECVLNMFDEQCWKSQRVKNLFDLNEKEVYYKQCFMNYWIDLTSYVNKALINKQQQPGKLWTNSDEIIENIIHYAKSKIEQYKTSFNNQSESLYKFQFLNNNNNLWLSTSTSCLAERIGKFTLSTTLGNNYNQRKAGRSDRYNNENNNNNNNININSNSNSNNYINRPFSGWNEQENQNENHNKNSNEQKNYNEILDNEMNCYIINNTNNLSVPLLSDYALHFLENDELGLYTNITIFLKNEYTKLDQLNTLVNTKLNMLILDKIKLYTEETFTFIQDNINNKNNRQFFKEKLNVLISNISDYKKNFFLDMPDDYEQRRNNMNNADIKHGFNPSVSIEDKMNITSKSMIFVQNAKKNNIDEIKENVEDNNTSKNESLFGNNSTSSKISGSFNNFYTQYNPSKSLSKNISTPFTHEFFNYKKNKYEVDTKLNMWNY